MSSISSIPQVSPGIPLPTTEPASSTPLESLLPHLLASKRSLSSITHVHRASTLCAQTRAALESSAITAARTAFLRSGILSQLSVLGSVHQQTVSLAHQGRKEFGAVVRDLDEAGRVLRGTLDSLRGTTVEAGLRPEKEESRNLLDFVDEQGVESLIGLLKEIIDEAEAEMKVFEKSSDELDCEMRLVRQMLDEGKNERKSVGAAQSPIPEILHDMEDQAREMAANLESLVSHFDLCVTAIRHTEGGGDAASKLAGNLPDGVDIDQDRPPEPIGEEQWMEMFGVLEEDAGQVDDVVLEIRDRIVEMEAAYERVETHTEDLLKKQESMVAALKQLEDIGHKLPGYITQSQVFLVRWDEAKARIEERLEELEGLRGFYDSFLKAYDNLLIEVGRRKNVETRMEKVVEESRARLEKLYEDDLQERKAFSKEQGDFLPVDIWPGLMADPLRYDILPVDYQTSRVPDISKSVIHRAIRRVHGER